MRQQFDLSSCITDGVNCVEVYICKNKPEMTNHTDNDSASGSLSSIIDVSWNTANDLTKILKGYANFKNTTEVVEFYYRHLCYTYDRANDSQRVTHKKFIKDMATDNCYAVSYDEEVLPSHMYPCVIEQSHKTQIKRSSYRVNNRTYIIHDVDMDTREETMYIRYTHAPQVDLKKYEIDFQKAYHTLTKKY
jgi:hypothetical protein